jgi:hypothetical protein
MGYIRCGGGGTTYHHRAWGSKNWKRISVPVFMLIIVLVRLIVTPGNRNTEWSADSLAEEVKKLEFGGNVASNMDPTALPHPVMLNAYSSLCWKHGFSRLLDQILPPMDDRHTCGSAHTPKAQAVHEHRRSLQSVSGGVPGSFALFQQGVARCFKKTGTCPIMVDDAGVAVFNTYSEYDVGGVMKMAPKGTLEL